VTAPTTRPVAAHASAPVRLDLAGGWTDVPPFSAREGGVVIAAAIGLRTHADVIPGGDDIALVSEDLGECLTFPVGAEPASDELPLLRAAVRILPVGGCRLTTRCDAPKGSGLGSSGALDVALVAALSRARGEHRSAEALAALGWRVEAVEAGHPGGKQDQWTAALGGFQCLTFDDPAVKSRRLELDPAFESALAEATVLCYTGTSRFSGGTISRVMAAYERGDDDVVGALRGLRDTALAMAEALGAADLAAVAALLGRNWRYQCRLDGGMCTSGMSGIEAAAAAAGATGGKAAGSGAGGCMFFVAPGRRDAVARAVVEAGARLLPLEWSSEGVRAW
jgi:D-glycero-alpha-D-manno-heptose-7-phosphate kinase